MTTDDAIRGAYRANWYRRQMAEGAFAPTLGVTEAMIEAGTVVLSETFGELCTEDVIRQTAEEVYRVMAGTSQHPAR